MQPTYPDEVDARLAILAGGNLEPQQEPTDAERKRLSGLQARAALAGYQLVPMSGGDFVVERWGMVRALPDATAVEAFLRQVGAPA